MENADTVTKQRNNCALYAISSTPTEELPSDAGTMTSSMVIGVVTLLLGVWIHSPLATRKCCDIYESAVVEHPLLSTTSRIFLLLLLLDFGGL